jgi:hypothetical protein
VPDFGPPSFGKRKRKRKRKRREGGETEAAAEWVGRSGSATLCLLA